jgi:hypothetical protein
VQEDDQPQNGFDRGRNEKDGSQTHRDTEDRELQDQFPVHLVTFVLAALSVYHSQLVPKKAIRRLWLPQAIRADRQLERLGTSVAGEMYLHYTNYAGRSHEAVGVSRT